MKAFQGYAFSDTHTLGQVVKRDSMTHYQGYAFSDTQTLGQVVKRGRMKAFSRICIL